MTHRVRSQWLLQPLLFAVITFFSPFLFSFFFHPPVFSFSLHQLISLLTFQSSPAIHSFHPSAFCFLGFFVCLLQSCIYFFLFFSFPPLNHFNTEIIMNIQKSNGASVLANGIWSMASYQAAAGNKLLAPAVPSRLDTDLVRTFQRLNKLFRFIYLNKISL